MGGARKCYKVCGIFSLLSDKQKTDGVQNRLFFVAIAFANPKINHINSDNSPKDFYIDIFYREGNSDEKI